MCRARGAEWSSRTNRARWLICRDSLLRLTPRSISSTRQLHSRAASWELVWTWARWYPLQQDHRFLIAKKAKHTLARPPNTFSNILGTFAKAGCRTIDAYLAGFEHKYPTHFSGPGFGGSLSIQMEKTHTHKWYIRIHISQGVTLLKYTR